MKRFFTLDEASRDPDRAKGRVVTVGFFDGVHLGHLKILESLKAWGVETGCQPVVVTFDRHPQSILGGHPPVPVISLEHRLLLLAREAISATLVLRFDAELASWSPERFTREVLIEALGARRVLFGFDGAFGRGRLGTHDYLAARQDRLGVEVRRCDAEWLKRERVSSTILRTHLLEGRLDRAAAGLGRRFSLLGRVVHGLHRGRSIGFPTANLDIAEAAVLPRGVYFADVLLLGDSPRAAADARRDARSRLLPAVVNVGRCPTFHGEAPDGGDAFDPRRDKVEVHILDISRDLYGQWMEVFVERKHRSETRFDSVDALTTQIRADVGARIAAMKTPRPDDRDD